MNNNTTLQLIISGKVQGVSYRAWFRSAAENLGITGWVRNLSNGNVEALITGPHDKIEELINSAYKGSAYSDVAHIDISEQESYNVPCEFEIWASK